MELGDHIEQVFLILFLQNPSEDDEVNVSACALPWCCHGGAQKGHERKASDGQLGEKNIQSPTKDTTIHSAIHFCRKNSAHFVSTIFTLL